jgi:hypothetical protein
MNESNEARVPHRANPYARDTSTVRPYESPEPAVLTLRDLDRLVHARLRDAHREWADKSQHACAEAWERGREFGVGEGYTHAMDYAREQIARVVGGRLIHVRRNLSERKDRAKHTIADERTFMAGQADELGRAIRDLEGVGQ